MSSLDHRFWGMEVGDIMMYVNVYVILFYVNCQPINGSLPNLSDSLTYDTWMPIPQNHRVEEYCQEILSKHMIFH